MINWEAYKIQKSVKYGLVAIHTVEREGGVGRWLPQTGTLL